MFGSMFRLLRRKGIWIFVLAFLAQVPLVLYRIHVARHHGKDALLDLMEDIGSLYAFQLSGGGLWLHALHIIVRTTLALFAFSIAGRIALGYLISPQRGLYIPEIPVRLPMFLTGLIVPVIMGVSLVVGFAVGTILGFWVLSVLLVLIAVAFGAQFAASTIVALQGSAAEYSITGRESLPIKRGLWGHSARKAIVLILIAAVYFALPGIEWRMATSVLEIDVTQPPVLIAYGVVEALLLTLWIAASVCAWHQDNGTRILADRVKLEEAFH